MTCAIKAIRIIYMVQITSPTTVHKYGEIKIHWGRQKWIWRLCNMTWALKMWHSVSSCCDCPRVNSCIRGVSNSRNRGPKKFYFCLPYIHSLSSDNLSQFLFRKQTFSYAWTMWFQWRSWWWSTGFIQ